jgi:Flp pilus assembly protein TadB
MASKPNVRIGNAEREAAADDLGEHFRAGRLDVHEYDERITAAYAARTIEDLQTLFTDLPRIDAHRDRQAGQNRPAGLSLPLLLARGVGLAVLGALVLAVIIAGAPFVLIGLFVWLKLSGRMWGARAWPQHQAPAYYRSRGWA